MFATIDLTGAMSWALGAGALSYAGVIHWLLRRVKERAFKYALTLFETKRLVDQDAGDARLLDASESILRDLLRAEEVRMADQSDPPGDRRVELARLAGKMAKAMRDELAADGCDSCARARAIRAATTVSAKPVE